MAAGNYYIYKQFNGMLNISRVAGQPGAWINPSKVTKTTSTSSKTTTVSAPKSGSYTLKSSAKGYSNADDARNKVNQRTTLSAGTYYIYKTYNGMLNLTRKKGTPGSWINPNTVSAVKVTNTKTTTTIKAPTTGAYSLKNNVNGYTNAALAKSNAGSNSIVSAGTYYIYKTYNGMLNLSKTKGVPGSWVNPNAKSVVTSKVASYSSTITKDTTSGSPMLYSLRQLQFNGIIYWSGYKFTYYSQRVLPGGGLNIPGRHVNSSGYVADKDGYIVLANSAPKGTVINTPFGFKGKVYDRGTYGNHFDVYTK